MIYARKRHLRVSAGKIKKRALEELTREWDLQYEKGIFCQVGERIKSEEGRIRSKVMRGVGRLWHLRKEEVKEKYI